MCVLANLCLRWSTLPGLSLPSFFILLPLCRFCIAGLYLPCSLVRSLAPRTPVKASTEAIVVSHSGSPVFERPRENSATHEREIRPSGKNMFRYINFFFSTLSVGNFRPSMFLSFDPGGPSHGVEYLCHYVILLAACCIVGCRTV